MTTTTTMPTTTHIKARVFTRQQQREIALKYASLKHGQKGPYIASLGVSRFQIRDWISALADGDLDNGRFPRKTGTMTNRDIKEIQRLQECLKQAEEKNARQREHYEKKLADKDSQIEKLEKASDALGKAITVLQNLSERHGKAANN